MSLDFPSQGMLSFINLSSHVAKAQEGFMSLPMNM